MAAVLEKNKSTLGLEKARRVRYNKIVKNRELTSLIINAPLRVLSP